jgi:hypothetical protein
MTRTDSLSRRRPAFFLEETYMANSVAHGENGESGLDRPRELLTLAIVIGCVGFWSFTLWAVGAI